MRGVDTIRSAIYSTIDDVHRWQEVLRIFSEFTGAKKGIVTLRDRLSAELVIPSEVHHDLSSPLLYGFSEREVESYITEYIHYDPWTEIEKLYHPTLPYPLSKYIDVGELKVSPFWQWLEPQGISDTIVLDIGTFTKNWVAMNLYYPVEKVETKKKILEYTSALQTDMQNAWQYGQRYRASQLNTAYLKYFLEQQSFPAFLLDPDGLLVLANTKGISALNSNIGIYIDANNFFQITDAEICRKFYSELESFRSNHGRVSVREPVEKVLSCREIIITITLLADAEDKIGADRSIRLVTLRNQLESQELSARKPVWDNPSLTKRERQLVELMANGGRVVDFMRLYNLSKSTAHFHWGNVKRKLKIQERSEIYAQHQIFRRNL